MSDEEKFITLSDNETLKKIRKYYGMSDLMDVKKNCRGCGQLFPTQLAGSRQIIHYCAQCHQIQRKEGKFWTES